MIFELCIEGNLVVNKTTDCFCLPLGNLMFLKLAYLF